MHDFGSKAKNQYFKLKKPHVCEASFKNAAQIALFFLEKVLEIKRLTTTREIIINFYNFLLLETN